MLSFRKVSIVVFVCDISQNSGEGFLAHAVIAKLSEQDDVQIRIYNDQIIDWLRLYEFSRDRLLPIYLTFVIALHLLIHKHCLLLNYTPAWNFLNAVLTRFGLRLGPITGSVGVIPALAGKRQQLIRGALQNLMVRMAICLLPPNRFQWAATPTVYAVLVASGKFPVKFGFPFVPYVKAIPTIDKMYDFFFYSTTHPIKNHAATLLLVERLSKLGYRLCCVGDGFFDLDARLIAYDWLSENEFNMMLGASRVFVSTSFEDAGITALKALASGLPILCPQTSGMAVMAQNDPRWCFSDPCDTVAVCGQAIELLKTAESDARLARRRFSVLKDDANAAFLCWKATL
jgi:glycosyltransferase involved in cell wall biosynthesis